MMKRCKTNIKRWFVHLYLWEYSMKIKEVILIQAFEIVD